MERRALPQQLLVVRWCRVVEKTLVFLHIHHFHRKLLNFRARDAEIYFIASTTEPGSEPSRALPGTAPVKRGKCAKSQTILWVMSNHLGALLNDRPNFLPSALVIEFDVEPAPQKGYLGLSKCLVAIRAAAMHV